MPDDNDPLAPKDHAAWLEALKHPENRCWGCGLLGKQVFMRGGAVFSVAKLERESGYLFGTPESGPELFLPVCLAGHAIETEVLSRVAAEAELGKKKLHAHVEGIQAVFFFDRQCGDWEEWNRYFTPQWHLEQRRMKDLTKMQMGQAQNLTDMQLDHAEKLAEMQRRSDKQQSRFNWFFVCLTVVALILAIGQIGYPNGLRGIHFPFAREEALFSTPTQPPIGGTPELQPK